MADQPTESRHSDRAPASNAPPTDAGKTSGGGSLGHDQPDDVADEAPIRNQGGHRGQTGGTRETVGPAD